MNSLGRVLNLTEVAKLLRVNRHTVYRLLKTNGIPAFRVGADWRFQREEIERWMEFSATARSLKPSVKYGPPPRRRKSQPIPAASMNVKDL